jgi:hypothetical protein
MMSIQNCAAGVTVSTASYQDERAGSNPSAALHALKVRPIPFVTARELVERNHYLHSLPGGTMLCFGVFIKERLQGTITFGAGPYLAYHLVENAKSEDCLTLTRLWLADELPANSESRVLGIITRLVQQHTETRFLISYADPVAGHLGTIYQAAGWLYTGLSSATPLYDIGDGVARHSRSLAHDLGSHSIQYLKLQGIKVKLVSQSPKHRYIKFLDESWRNRLSVPTFPYPKKEAIWKL